MIGVAFALQKTFGTAPGVASEAFGQVVREFARPRALNVGAADIPADESLVPSSARLRLAFSAALSPYLLRETENVQLESMFRMKTARVLADRFVPFDDVAPTLTQLASLNVPCAALSGGWPSIDQRKAQIAGFAGPIVFSEDLGVAPDAPAVFVRIAQTLRLPADRIWFVGTDVRNEILPAAAVGMRTIWINRGDDIFPTSRSRPDATITTFGDLLDVLSGPYTRGLLELRHILRTCLDWRPGHFISAEDSLALEALEREEDET